MSDTQGNQGGGQRPRRNNNGNRNQNRNRNNNNRNRNNNNRNNNNNRRPRKQTPRPLVLTFWQKCLKAVGLFNEEKARKKLQPPRKATTKKTAAKKAAKSNTRVAKTAKRKPQVVPVETPRLYVGNLSYDATEFDIEELFKGIGSVRKVEIIYNRNTHRSKGYGFVQMLNTDDAKRAVEVLHEQPFMGRNLIVNGSKARKESDPNSETTDA